MNTAFAFTTASFIERINLIWSPFLSKMTVSSDFVAENWLFKGDWIPKSISDKRSKFVFGNDDMGAPTIFDELIDLICKEVWNLGMNWPETSLFRPASPPISTKMSFETRGG